MNAQAIRYCSETSCAARPHPENCEECFGFGFILGDGGRRRIRTAAEAISGYHGRSLVACGSCGGGQIDIDHVLAHLESAARALPAAMSLPLRSQAVADARAVIIAGVFRGFAVEQGAVAAIEACRDGVAALRLRVDEAGLQMPTVAENIEGFVRAFEKVPAQVWEVPASLLS